MKIINIHYGCYTTPDIDEMLKYDFWELHEAVFILTRWPDHVYTCFCIEAMHKTNISRQFFYLPGPHPERQRPQYPYDPNLEYQESQYFFEPISMGRDFIHIYEAMREAIKRGNLTSRAETLLIGDVYGEGLSYLLSPYDVIRWAYLNCTGLSESFQKALGIYLFKRDDEKPDAVQKKVRIKVIGQFLRYYYPKQRSKFYCEHHWMQCCITADELVKDKYGVIRNALNELRDPNRIRKKGNTSKKNVENEPYFPKAIEEVLFDDLSGVRRYYIPLLKVAIETAAITYLKKYLEDKKHSKTNLDQYLDGFMLNDVVSIYTAQAPPLILEFIREFAENAVFDFFNYSEIGALIESGKMFWKGNEKHE